METQHIAESSRKEKENRIMRFYGQNVLKSLAVLGTIVIFLSIFFLCLPTIQSYGLTSNSQEMAENTSVEGRKTISSDKILLENQTEKQYIPVLLPPHNKSIPNVATATLLDYQSHLNDCAKRFKDVHGHWAEKSGILDLALSEKLINGFSYHTFGPNESITRGQVATILFNFAKSNEDTTVFTFTDFFSSPSSTDIENNTTPFTDNPNGKYYTGSMNWCYDNSIFTGYDLLGTEKICAAAQPITRAELCAVLHRFASCLYGDGNASEAGPSNNNIKNMSDYNDIPNWSINDCIWANNEKLITGKPGNLFAPNDNTTRA